MPDVFSPTTADLRGLLSYPKAPIRILARDLCVSGSGVRDDSFYGCYRKLCLLPLQLV